MISVASLRSLVAAGVSAEQIVDVVEAELAADAGALEERRSRDRDRKARQRSRDRLAVPVTSRKSRDTHDQPIETLEDFKASVTDDVDALENSASLSLTSSSEDFLGKKERVVVARARGASRDRGTRLPDDWLPDGEGQTLASETLGQWAYRELEKFRDHWKAQPGSRGLKRDWNATWRNWVRRASEYGNKGSNGHGRKRTVSEVADAFIAELDDKIRREEAEAGNGAGQSSLGLLPPRQSS